MRLKSIATSVFIVLAAGSAFAQAPPPDDPVANAPIRFGAVALAPRISLSNVGVDTNVFNDVQNPKEDLTFTLSPSTDLWMRTSRGLLTVNGGADLTYFNKYRTQRSLNGIASAEYEYRFNRLRPFAKVSFANARERPGFEIDLRARRFEDAVQLGMDLRVGGKSFIELRGRRVGVRYARAEIFNGRELDKALNRTLQGVDLAWRRRLSVLTTWVVRATGERERFEFESERNADSARIVTGFELSKLALVRGAAFIGYRRVVGTDGGRIPEFSGLTADVDATYSAPTRTRLNLVVERDVQHSYDVMNPYYVQTGWVGTVTQQLVGRFDLQVLGGRRYLSYRTTSDTLSDRRDRIDQVGGGMGYTLGDSVRVSLDVQSVQRQSQRAESDYKTLRAGVSVNYGF